MFKLTKILASATLVASLGAWSASNAYADLLIQLDATSAATIVNTNYYTQTYSIDISLSSGTGTFYDLQGTLGATNFPLGSFSSFTFASPYTNTSGSTSPVTDVNGAFTNNSVIGFHVPGSSAGVPTTGIAISTTPTSLATLTVTWASSFGSTAPDVKFTPTPYVSGSSYVSAAWSEGSTFKNTKTGTATALDINTVAPVSGLHVTTSNTPFSIDKAGLDTYATKSITVDAGTSLTLTASTTSGLVNEIDGSKLTLNGTFDITNHDLIIHNSTEAAVGALIANGHLVSGNVSANVGHDALGYGLASDLGLSTFDGVAVSGSDILVKFTLAGDGNLDSTVDSADFVLLSNHYGSSVANGTGWDQGDYNGDGVIDSADFVLLSNNYGYTSPLLAAPVSDTPAAVPEPASLALLTLGAGALLARKRKH